MSSVEERIEKMLLRYLLEEKDIVAGSAYLDCTNSALDDGCDTCGYGGTEISFDICYKLPSARFNSRIEIPGDPLNFFPALLKYAV